MMLLGLFLVLAIASGLSYGFSRFKFHPVLLVLTVWLAAISVAQLRLSPYELPWPTQFWLLLGMFLILTPVTTVCAHWYLKRLQERHSRNADRSRPVPTMQVLTINQKLFYITSGALILAAVAANGYILSRFGTLPLLSTIPDRMRFIINKEIFGLWEYAALLPRIIIPLAFIFFLQAKEKRDRIIAAIIILLGLSLLWLYASRVLIVFVILMCYFSYLALYIKTINWKRLIVATILTAIITLTVSAVIPAIRQYITYKDYYGDVDYNPFTYLVDLSDISIPKSLEWIIPLYLVPSFNLQELMRAQQFYADQSPTYGLYAVSQLSHLTRVVGISMPEVTIPWKQIFLPWWVTGTSLFSFWVEFRYFGIALASILIGAVSAASYWFTKNRTSLTSVLLFSYLSFVLVMSIYTNYALRIEFYLDVPLLVGLGWVLNQKRYLINQK